MSNHRGSHKLRVQNRRQKHTENPAELVMHLEFSKIVSQSNPRQVALSIEKLDLWAETLKAEPFPSQANVIDNCVARIYKQTQGKDLLFNLLVQIYQRLAFHFPVHIQKCTRLCFFDRIFDLRDKDFPDLSRQFRVKRCCHFAALACSNEHVNLELLNAMLIPITSPHTRPFIVDLIRKRTNLTESLTELILQFTFEECSSDQGVVGMLDGLISARFSIENSNFDSLFFRRCLDRFFEEHPESSYINVHALPLWQRLQSGDFQSESDPPLQKKKIR